jgi:peptidoglycan/LPS O-acetylase OafA/YrhL
MKYRKEIDGLRALAVLPVILFHAGFTTFSGGFVGVDIFFVISGYLITTIIVDEMEKGKFSLFNFYDRRARRILPALFFVMLCTLPFAWFWMLPRDLKSFSESLVAVPLFASNILFYLTSGYFDAASVLKPLLHTWSLAVEEQYYVLFPLFLMLAWKLGKKWIISLLLLIAIVSLLAAQWGSPTHPSFTFYLLPTRGFEILIGALISFYKSSLISVSQSVSQSVSLTGLALVLYAIFAFDSNTPSPSLYSLVPTIGAGLILVFTNSKNLVGKLLGSKLFVGIGLISYSAYLWHQPLLAYSKIYTFDQNPLSLTISLLLATFVLSMLSYKYIETPFRRSSKFSKKTIIFLPVFFMLFFIIIGLYGYKERGITQRLSSQIISLSKAQDDWDHPGQLKKLNIDNLYVYDEKKPINILFFGDSHAEQFAPVASYISSKTGKNVGFLTGGGCPPIPNLLEDRRKHCFDLFNRLEHLINVEKNIETIVIAGCYNCYFIDQMGPTSDYSYYYRDGEKHLHLKQGKGLNETFTSFEYFINDIALKMNVVVIGDIPQSDNFDPNVIALSQFRGDLTFFYKKFPAFTDSQFLVSKESSSLNRKIQKLVESKATFLNSQEIVCPNQICIALDSNGEAKYSDRGHMRASYVSIEFNKIILNLITDKNKTSNSETRHEQTNSYIDQY